MVNNTRISVPLEIKCTVADAPESSGLLDQIRDLGFNQESVTIALPEILFKGTFVGTAGQLAMACKSLVTGQP